MHAVIYCRVSTVEQTHNLSLETQEHQCRAYCARAGYVVDAVFVDAGESAKTANRPAFLQLLAHCRARTGRVHAVVVYSLTRFSRNTADHHGIAALLRGLGVTLRSVTEPIDDSPTGRLMEAVLAGVAQFDNDVRSERAIAGMKMAAQKGRWQFLPPLGYQTGRREGPSLDVDPVVGPLIQRAFAAVADAQLLGHALRAHLKAIGLRGRAGEPLSKSRLYAILRHPVYTGRIERPAWGVSTVGDFPPLVSAEMFARVQRALAPRRTPQQLAVRHRNHPDFPLRRFVRCAACGRAVTGSWSRGRTHKYAYYHCVTGCTHVGKVALEDAFLQLLDRLRPKAGYLELLRGAILEQWRGDRDAAAHHQRALETRIAHTTGRLGQLEQAFIYDGRVDAETYQRQRDALREQLTLLRLERQDAEATAADVESMLAFAEHALAHASAIWTAAASTEERIRIQTTFFPEGVVWRAGGSISQKAPATPLENPKKNADPRTAGGFFMEPRNCLQVFKLEKPPRKSSVGRTLRADLGTWVAFLKHMNQLRAAA